MIALEPLCLSWDRERPLRFVLSCRAPAGLAVTLAAVFLGASGARKPARSPLPKAKEKGHKYHRSSPRGHAPVPQAAPMQAVNQMDAAVVRPWILPGRWLRKITPAPRNPIPVIIPCMTRLAPATVLISRHIGCENNRGRAKRDDSHGSDPGGLAPKIPVEPMATPIKVAAKRRNIRTESNQAWSILKKRHGHRSIAKFPKAPFPVPPPGLPADRTGPRLGGGRETRFRQTPSAAQPSTLRR